MKLLPDSCAILHFSAAPDCLSHAVLARLTAADSVVWCSVISIGEIAEEGWSLPEPIHRAPADRILIAHFSHPPDAPRHHGPTDSRLPALRGDGLIPANTRARGTRLEQ